MFKPQFRLYSQDIVEYLESSQSEEIQKVNLVVTSPPYNYDIKYDKFDDNVSFDRYLDFLRKVFRLLFDRLSSQSRLVIILKDNYSEKQFVHFEFYNIMKEIGYNFFGEYKLKTPHISKLTAWGSWLSASCPRLRTIIEYAMVFYKGDWKRLKGISNMTREEFIDYTLDFWDSKEIYSSGVNRKEHPAQFSPKLVERFIRIFSYERDTMLDIFCGVGNAGIAAIRNSRNFIGIDLSEQYINVARSKIQKELSDLGRRLF